MRQIKKYINRKYYDSRSGRYVTLNDLKKFVESGEEIRVTDNFTGQDITNDTLSRLIQFVLAQKNNELLTKNTLTQAINNV